MNKEENKELKKKLDYYLSLRYPVEIIPIPEDEGGGYMARIPQFGDAIVGDGNTPEEALADLEEFKKERFFDFLKEGKLIPEPEKEKYSGVFIVRVPKFLHRALAEEAKRNGVSFNQFVNTLLSQAIVNYKTVFYSAQKVKGFESRNYTIDLKLEKIPFRDFAPDEYKKAA